MKKIVLIILSLILLFSMTSCTHDSKKSSKLDDDLQYILDKGTLVVGITEFAPMDYQNEEGKWIGFDADLAGLFAKSLNVDVEYQIIDWDSKVMELESKKIDVVWNGMTLTDETRATMSCSNPYFNNAQVVIVPVEDADKYQTLESVGKLKFAVEAGSAAKIQADNHNFDYIETADQSTALLEVSSGTSDAAIIDYLMSKAMTGPGSNYENLTSTVSLSDEQYAVGFRKGSNLPEVLNDFFKEIYKDGTMYKIADTYGISEKLIEQ